MRTERTERARRALLVGFGVTNRAVADALIARGHDVIVADDTPAAAVSDAARARGIEIIDAPHRSDYFDLVRSVAMVVPSPGLGDSHPALDAALETGVAVRSEFDLAADWDSRPILAITGTDGKTTVTTLTTQMLDASGIKAVAAGNTELPLVAAIADPSAEVFVVEASSFRLDHTARFEPAVATWLNLGTDHLDRHRSQEAYEAAKARIWQDQSVDCLAVGSADDPVVRRHLHAAAARHVSFGYAVDADYRVDGSELRTPGGDVIASAVELWRSFPHDLSNHLAAAATALGGGATLEGCRDAIVGWRGLPHRIELVADDGRLRYYDDSKATTPGAALAALRSFASVVLIAGGRNKGLDLRVLANAAEHIRAVVAIGEAAEDISATFSGLRPVSVATSMAQAVSVAVSAAQPGDAILLSPACASFDWYSSYAERGDDFRRHVHEQIGAP